MSIIRPLKGLNASCQVERVYNAHYNHRKFTEQASLIFIDATLKDRDGNLPYMPRFGILFATDKNFAIFMVLGVTED
jgi:hypothetical protein